VSKCARVKRIVLAACVVLCFGVWTASVCAEAEPLKRYRYLLLDSRVIESTENAKLTLGTVIKHEKNPLFGEDKPWEPRFDNMYPNVIYDAKAGLYKCWYFTFNVDKACIDTPRDQRKPGTYLKVLRSKGKGARTDALCYAFSKDGIKWSKPLMDIQQWNGERSNIVVTDRHGAGVFKDTQDKDPDHRYKMFFKKGGLCVSFSPDGVRWSKPTECPGIAAAGDTHNNAFWAPELKKYVGITRLWKDGQRIVGRTESKDFTKWTKAIEVLRGDRINQVYALTVFRYEGVYLGFAMIFNTRKDRTDCELAWSPDTIEWHRIQPGTPLIANSEKKGEYDWGCVYAGVAPVLLKDKIRIYYGASNGPHTDWRDSFLCLATLRRDGWAGYEPAKQDRPATIMTHPVICAGKALRVTADAAGGAVRVAVLDAKGNLLARSKPIAGDITDAEVSFEQGNILSSFVDQPIRLKFELKEAKLYSFAFTTMKEGLRFLDWVIIGLYAAAVLGTGWYYSRKQKSTDEYFVGSGKMSPLLVGVSLFATLLSTISYLSVPGEYIAKGPASLVSMAHIPVTFFIVGYILLPVFMKNRVISAYELLELRLGYGIRALGASMFIILRLVWMSLLVYLAAKAMTVMFGIPAEEQSRWIPWIVLISGFIAVLYTSMGGMRAVVITDFMQTILLFGGALLVLAMVTLHFGGFGWFPTEWQIHWDRQPFFDFDPSRRITMVGVVLSTIIWCVCTAGGDQTAVQRFMSTQDPRAARRSYLVNLCVGTVVIVTLCLVGFGLMAYVRETPGVMPAYISLERNADDIFPRYIAYNLPAGISGLVVAAMFAAAMSSIDSGVNSITAVVMTDFLDRFDLRPETDRGHVLFAKGLAFSIGAIVVVGSSFMQHVKGNITAVTSKTTNLLVTPIFALFFFALFVPFARPIGVFAGAICGTATAILIAFSGPFFGFHHVTGYDPVSFMWIGPVALAVNIAVGTVVSLLVGGPQRQLEL